MKGGGNGIEALENKKNMVEIVSSQQHNHKNKKLTFIQYSGKLISIHTVSNLF